MRSPSGENVSVWLATADLLQPPPLFGREAADVCVVGAGIAGLTTAYMLALEGRSVVVIDDGEIGSGETHHTTAHLANALDDRYYEIERVHGTRGAKLAGNSHTAAIDAIEEIVGRENIECDFERIDGYLVVPPEESADVLSKEAAAAQRAGVHAEYTEHVPLPFYDFGPALRFPRQGQLHALKYLNGLAAAVKRLGGRIYGNTHATHIEDGERPHVDTATGAQISAKAIVVATNTPVNDRVAMHTKQAAYRTYVIAARVPAHSIPHVLLWDTPDPYHYVRLQSANGDRSREFLIVGGEDHKTGQADDADKRFEALEAWTRERFPMVEDVALRWSGQIMEPVDAMAFIGRNPGGTNVYIATGDSGNGMTHGTIAGMLLTDLIAGRENAWATLYDPARKSLRAAMEFTRENLNMAAQYADHLTPGDVGSVEEIAPGEGVILRRGFRQIAAYRDEQGNLHEHSAVCSHLGCIVAWNSTEQSWDCPCHGSRYDKLTGQVLNGPAITGLTPANE
ncbi:MAG TPA: FAD-dependent oxidoreductase [Thermoanaerobaculia bacterium]|nr:FAD-dependent oxidoreductase [Burkholderiales bacterium]HYC58950.1 FAD-dependent oxidoreductase [Thermoanaerobaculia bacterium]